MQHCVVYSATFATCELSLSRDGGPPYSTPFYKPNEASTKLKQPPAMEPRVARNRTRVHQRKAPPP